MFSCPLCCLRPLMSPDAEQRFLYSLQHIRSCANCACWLLTKQSEKCLLVLCLLLGRPSSAGWQFSKEDGHERGDSLDQMEAMRMHWNLHQFLTASSFVGSGGHRIRQLIHQGPKDAPGLGVWDTEAPGGLGELQALLSRKPGQPAEQGQPVCAVGALRPVPDILSVKIPMATHGFSIPRNMPSVVHDSKNNAGKGMLENVALAQQSGCNINPAQWWEAGTSWKNTGQLALLSALQTLACCQFRWSKEMHLHFKHSVLELQQVIIQLKLNA